jgi:hypothetical protein
MTMVPPSLQQELEVFTEDYNDAQKQALIEFLEHPDPQTAEEYSLVLGVRQKYETLFEFGRAVMELNEIRSRNQMPYEEFRHVAKKILTDSRSEEARLRKSFADTMPASMTEGMLPPNTVPPASVPETPKSRRFGELGTGMRKILPRWLRGKSA